MLIKEAVRQDCEKCGRFEKEISPEQHGCDKCKKPIVPYGNDERLDVRIFYSGNHETDTFYFCSWKCVFAFVSRIDWTDHFFVLPYVSFDNKIKGRTGKDFLREARKIGKYDKRKSMEQLQLGPNN